MSRIHNWLILITLLVFVSTPSLSAPPRNYAFLDLTQAMQQASASHKPVFLYFGRYGCSTCRKMHAEVFSDPVLAMQFAENFILAYVDTESDNRIRLPNGERTTEMQFATRNRILGTPTFVYFSPEQKPLFSKAGFQSIEQMSRYNAYVAEGIYLDSNLEKYLTVD